MTSPAVLDRERLKRLAALGEPGLVEELIGDYRAQAAEVSAQLRVAVEAGDVASVQALAHGLKGSSGMLGVDVVAAVCAQIEYSHTLEPALLLKLDESLAAAYVAFAALRPEPPDVDA